MRQNRCIDSETLADYLEGRLHRQAHKRVENHLSGCSRCVEALLLVRRVFHPRSHDRLQAVPTEVTQRTIAQLDRAQPGGRRDMLMGCFKALSLEWSRMLHRIGYPPPGALVPVRGKRVTLSDNVVILSHSFPGMNAKLEIERVDSQWASMRVAIAGPDEEFFPLRVSLVCREREVASYLIYKEDGKEAACFESVPFDRYSLVYTHNGANIGQYDFSIKSTDDGGQDG